MTEKHGSKDFRALRESQQKAGPGKLVGLAFCRARDALASGLVRVGATPNRVTVAGFAFTCGAGACLALGAGHQVPYWRAWVGAPGPVSYWPLWAGVFLILSAACDMLDGAVARVGNRYSKFGGFLDSTLDRFSDSVIFLGCAAYFAWHGNLTYQLLTFVALTNTVLISYIKARAEDIVPDCSVGWWQRGERYVTLLLGCFFGHVPAILWQLAILPAFTVWRRLVFAWRAIGALEGGRPQPDPLPPRTWWGRLMLSYWPRGSWQHDIVAGANIAYIILPPLWIPALRAVEPYVDPLRAWLGG